MSGLNRSYILLGYLSLFGLGILDMARGPFYPDISVDLNLTDTQASLFFATASIVMIFSGRMVPTFAHWVGLVKTIRFGLTIMGIGFVGISLARDLSTMLIGCAVFGFGFGVINVGQNFLIIEGSSAVWRRRLLSGLHSIYALACLFAPVIASVFFRMGMDWRQSFRCYAVCVLAGIVASFFVDEDRPITQRQAPRRMTSLERRNYLTLALALSFYVIGELTISTRLALYLRRVYDFSPEMAAGYLGVFFLLLFIGRAVFTTFSFVNLPSSRIMQTSFLISTVFFLLGLNFSPYFIVFCGLTMAPAFGVGLDFVAERFPDASRQAISYSLAITGIFIVMMHFIVGALTEAYGIENAMYFGPISLAGAGLVMWRMGRQKAAV